MSDAPKKIGSQAGQVQIHGGYQAVDPLKMAPAFMQLTPRTGVALTPVFDIGDGATVESDTIACVFPDEGVAYAIDDIVVSCVDEAVNEATATLKIGIKGSQYNPSTLTATAKDDDNYFLDATLPTIAVGDEVSVSNGDLSWPSTADTQVERTFLGKAYLRVTSTAVTTGGKTGQVRLFVRYHAVAQAGGSVTGSPLNKYPSLSTETDA